MVLKRNKQNLTGLYGETVGGVGEFIGCSECSHFDTVCRSGFKWPIAVATQSILAIFHANREILNCAILERIVRLDDLVRWPNAVGLDITPAGHFQTRRIL